MYVCVPACARAGGHEHGADMRHETRYEAPSGDAAMFIKIIGQTA